MNHFILWVAIADVSYYVKSNTALDQEAYARGTSVYFPERAFHMLPRALSENLCSLKPKVPRLALTAQIEIDRNGQKIKTQIFESVIKSVRRATYKEIASEYENNKQNPAWEFAPHFELFRILKKAKEKRGALDFELPDPEVLVAADGEPKDIKNRLRLDSHRLIEEFMICANEAVTEWILKQGRPFIYRTHAAPSEITLKTFSKLSKTVGALTLQANSSSKQISTFLKKIENHPAKELLHSALLRSMKQAIYQAKHEGHFGLSSFAYTHFTSPIRRYPDLMAHRLLKLALKGKSFGKSENLSLDQLSEHCSYRERIAQEAERESHKLKQVRLLSHHLGQELEGKVSGFSRAGIFVRLLTPFAEGFIPFEELHDDFYVFDEEKMIVYGKRKKRTFKIGQTLKVVVIRARLEKRRAEFALSD